MRQRWFRGSGLLIAVGLSAALSACGSSSSTDGPAANSGSLTLAASPATVSVQQGNTATVTIAVTRSGGFTGAVTLSAGTLPTGVTASFSPSQVPGSSNSATLTITVAATAAAGTYSIPVQGQGTGVANASTTVSLTVTAAPPPAGFQLTLASGTASAPQGGGATVGVTIARSGSFTGPVNLAVENLPTGVSAAFSAAPIPAGSTTSTLTLNAAATVAAGTYNLTVRGTATGLTDQTAALALTVTAVSQGSYTLSVAPATLSLQQGANGTAQVNIARTGGFTGAVSLAVTAPAGVTATLNPAQAGSGVNASTLSVAVGSNVAAGNYSLTITGTAQGLANQTATLALTVTASGGGGGGGNLAWQFCNPSDLPLWFAFQDGTGAWTAVAAGANNTYSFSLASNRGGVAWVTPGSAANSFEVEIIYGTRTELTQLGTERCAATPPTKTVNGTTVGLGQLDIALVTLGTAATAVTGALGQTFSIQNVPDGTRDLFASRSNALSLAVDRLFLRRNVNYAAGSTITPAVDFGGNESFAPATHNVTLGNLGSELAALASSFYTANARSVGIMVNTTPSAGAAKTWPSLPASQIQAGEFHLVVSTAVPFAGSANGRSAGRFLATPGATTLDFGPASSFGTPTVAGTAPYARLRYQGTLQTEYGNAIIAGYTQGNNRSVTITATSGYLGGTAYDVALPDFTGVGTWSNTWAPAAGAATNWTFQAWGWTGTGLGGILGPPLADNATFRTGYKGGQLTP